MPRRCVVIALPGGGAARVQLSGVKVCTYCGRLAERLCDARLRTGPRAGRTCDLPMCRQCTTGPHQDVDYCRDHKEA
jgi:hypothetical protein